MFAGDKRTSTDVQKRLLQALLFFILPVLTATSSEAKCLNSSVNERLSNFCLVKGTSNTLVTQRTVQVIDYRLKKEGYERGLGLPGRVDDFSFNSYIAPVLDYETDINGGNPNKPLQLGDISFTGEPDLVRKEGIVAGARSGAYGRFLLGEGRYVDYGFEMSYAHSFEHDIGLQRRFVNVCSKNHINNWWYIDGCANSSYVEQDLTEKLRNTLSLTTSKLFTLAGDSHHQASFGVNRVYDKDYEQNQLVLGLDTIHSNGWYSSINTVFGESIDGEMATREAVSASLALPVRNRRLTLSASYSESDGAKLLGFKRADDTWSVSAAYNVYKAVDLSVGYTETVSTIDYFDVSTPTVSVSFTPISF